MHKLGVNPSRPEDVPSDRFVVLSFRVILGGRFYGGPQIGRSMSRNLDVL